jgi:hypothetical protein
MMMSLKDDILESGGITNMKRWIRTGMRSGGRVVVPVECRITENEGGKRLI